MHLFYNASQIIKMAILVDLSATFSASVNIGMVVKQMARLSKVAQSFLGTRFLALLSQSDKTSQYRNEYRMLSSFVRTLPFKFHQLLVWLQKPLMTQFIQLRWLETVSSTFQGLEIDGSLQPLYTC